VVYGYRKFLQRFLGVLDPSPQLIMEYFLQVAVTVTILEHRRNLFVRRPCGDAM
jgi:hypothetical protein